MVVDQSVEVAYVAMINQIQLSPHAHTHTHELTRTTRRELVTTSTVEVEEDTQKKM